MAESINERTEKQKDKIAFVKSVIALQAVNRAEKSPSSSDKILFGKDNIEKYRLRLSEQLSPNLPAKELILMLIRSALEVEFGPNFTLNKGFDKMVNKLADSVMTNPDLRRQALSVVGTILEAKASAGKKN